MPSQRHLVYLLPRADPEELLLQESVSGSSTARRLPPCTCSSYTPLELRVRIPSSPSGSGSTSKAVSSSGSTTTTTAASTSSSRLRSRTEDLSSSNSSSSRPASTTSAPGIVSDDAVIPTSNSDRRRTSTSTPSSSSPHPTHSRSASNSISSPSPSATSPLNSNRSTRQQFATWKLIAPQVKTISPTTNTYLLLEAFAGVSSTSLKASSGNNTSAQEEDRGNSLLEKVHQLNLGQTSSPLPTPLYSPNRYTPFPSGCDPFSFSFASASNMNSSSSSIPPTRTASSSSSISISTTSAPSSSRSTIVSPTKSTLSTIIESSLSEENVSEKSGSTRTTIPATDTATTPPRTSSAGTDSSIITPDDNNKDHTCQHRTSITRPVLHSVFSGLSAASSEVTASSGASLLRDSRAAEDITARDEVLETADQEQLHAESAKCTCTTSKGANGSNETVTVPAPTSPEVLQRSFSSSTLSSAAGMSRTSSLNGRKKPPTAYRKEMESVLFAQSASPSASSSSSSSNNKRIHSGSSSGGRFCSSTIPTLTSSIFSTPTPDSIWYTHPSDISASSAYSSKSRSSSSLSTTSPISPSSNVSIESIPFLVDAPTLIDRTRLKHNNSYNQNDRFYIGGHNSIVVHVNDLNWYLEKVLWKLGLHRKGRKEFMSYWLPRFSNDDYVALRFLTQDDIEAFAPIEISVVSPPPLGKASSIKDDKTALVQPPSTSTGSLGSSPMTVTNITGQQRRDSQQSVDSTASSIGEETDGGCNKSSLLSSRSMTQSTSSRSDSSSTPPSEIDETGDEKTEEDSYSFHRIHLLFQRLKIEDINLFQYRVKYRSGSSTLGVIDWSEIQGIAPTEESKREDKVRVLHVSATDLGNRGLYFG